LDDGRWMMEVGSWKIKPFQTISNHFKLIQTKSNYFKPLQTKSNNIKPFQTSSNNFKTNYVSFPKVYYFCT